MLKTKGPTGCVALLFLLLISWPGHVAADEKTFPQFECLTPNVNFWIDIYGTYTTSQAVVHDSTNLSIVYDVIGVKPYDAPGSREINRKILDQVKTKYAGILKRLASGTPASGDAETSRVAALFGQDVDHETFRRAAENIRCQIGQKDRFRAGLIRSGAYMEQIREILRSYELPEDLAYLPHVESSFNVKAYSKFGAAGLWQFMRSTGQRFMQVGYVLDERRDPIRATHAAARLLKENYFKLEDWPLALTAYNHGAAGMENAKRLHGSYPQIFKYHHSRLFKFASRNFYSEFLAARHVASNYRDYFGDVEFDKPRPIQTVALEGYCSFETLRNHFGLDAAELIELNPALRPPVFSGQKLIPKGYLLNLPQNTDNGQTPLVAAIPASLYHSAQMPSRFYTVQAGDTASRIAKKHGVSLPALLAANNINPRSVLHPRQTLRIPGTGEASAPKIPSVEMLLATGNESPGEKLPEVAIGGPAQKSAGMNAAAQVTVYNVPEEKAAEAPAELAGADLPSSGTSEIVPEVFSSAIVEIAEAKPAVGNEGAGEKLPEIATTDTVGQPAAGETPEVKAGDAPFARADAEPPSSSARSVHSTVPDIAPTAASAETAEAEPTGEMTLANGESYPQPILAAVIPIPADTPPAGENNTQMADVQPNFEIVLGDMKIEELGKLNGVPTGQIHLEIEETLGHIAEWAKVRTQKIRDLNNLRFESSVQSGQRIKIPLNKVSAQEFAESRYEFHKRLQEDFFAVYRIGQLQPYQVKRGDNYWILCREKFGVPMWLLKHCNPQVDLSQLTTTQTLMIPTIEKTTGDEPGIGAPDEAEEDPVGSDQVDGEMPEKNESSQLPRHTS